MTDMLRQSRVCNFNFLAHHDLLGFGAIGEGISIQTTKDGRHILWMAHERAPKSFTAVDVTDPRSPKLVIQTDLPQPHMRSNSLAVVGDIMAVCYQTNSPGLQPAGFELFDVSRPDEPKSIAFFDASGPYSRGVHQLWFVDGRYIHMSAGAPDFKPHDQRDDQFYRIIDVGNLNKPVEVGRWWLPGTRDDEPPITRHPKKSADWGFRAHNTNVYPERPDRAYLGYLDGGMVILDISDMSQPKMVSRWDNSPPFDGFTHTVLPLFERELLIVTDEAVRLDGSDLPKLVWVLNNQDERNPIPIATFPTAAYPKPVFDEAGTQRDRIGAHNIHENVPGSWTSDQIILGAFFGAGLRAYDIANPYQPVEIGYFVPPPSPKSPTGCTSVNDVFVDLRGVVYAVDRQWGGLYTLEMNL
jgi:hypothetical protein